MWFRTIWYGLMLTFCVVFLFQGCVSKHIPSPVAVNVAGFNMSDKPTQVNLVNAQTNSDDVIFGSYGVGKLGGDLKTWTDAAIKMTKKSLEKKGVEFSSSALKTLKLSITEVVVDTAGIPMVASLARVKISLDAQTGAGYTHTYTETQNAMNPPWASDAAMKAVVEALLSDKTILEYLQK